ncbi:hypothetical protein J6590_040191 [Homalodisca vitripennis]|nr:hypothetical protein J6590_040191 [Homalodisca vitripennis]
MFCSILRNSEHPTGLVPREVLNSSLTKSRLSDKLIILTPRVQVQANFIARNSLAWTSQSTPVEPERTLDLIMILGVLQTKTATYNSVRLGQAESSNTPPAVKLSTIS